MLGRFGLGWRLGLGLKRLGLFPPGTRRPCSLRLAPDGLPGVLALLLGDLGVERALEVRGHAPELAHVLADGAADFRKALGPEHQQGHQEDHQKFRAANPEHMRLVPPSPAAGAYCSSCKRSWP